jgi:hypothetical protein
LDESKVFHAGDIQAGVLERRQFRMALERMKSVGMQDVASVSEEGIGRFSLRSDVPCLRKSQGRVPQAPIFLA